MQKSVDEFTETCRGDTFVEIAACNVFLASTSRTEVQAWVAAHFSPDATFYLRGQRVSRDHFVDELDHLRLRTVTSRVLSLETTFDGGVYRERFQSEFLWTDMTARHEEGVVSMILEEDGHFNSFRYSCNGLISS